MCPHASTRLTQPAKYATAAGGGYSESVPATRKEHRSRRLALARQAFFFRNKFKLGKLEKQKTLKRILFFSRMLVHERGPSPKIIALLRLPMLQTSNQVVSRCPSSKLPDAQLPPYQWPGRMQELSKPDCARVHLQCEALFGSSPALQPCPMSPNTCETLNEDFDVFAERRSPWNGTESARAMPVPSENSVNEISPKLGREHVVRGSVGT